MATRRFSKAALKYKPMNEGPNRVKYRLGGSAEAIKRREKNMQPTLWRRMDINKQLTTAVLRETKLHEGIRISFHATSIRCLFSSSHCHASKKVQPTEWWENVRIASHNLLEHLNPRILLCCIADGGNNGSLQRKTKKCI